MHCTESNYQMRIKYSKFCFTPTNNDFRCGKMLQNVQALLFREEAQQCDLHFGHPGQIQTADNVALARR